MAGENESDWCLHRSAWTKAYIASYSPTIRDIPRQRPTSSHCPDSAVGETRNGSVGNSCWNQGRKDISCRHQGRESMGERYLSESGVVRGKKVLQRRGVGAYCTPRSAEDMCEVVSLGRRRTGADPVSARSRVRADNGTLPWLQTKPWTSRE